ncbi:hypothetical protein D3C84_1203610 [compost metagenome]
MKLIDTELSFSGLSRRKGILDELQKVLEQDWGGLDEAMERRAVPKVTDTYKTAFESLKADIDGLLQ